MMKHLHPNLLFLLAFLLAHCGAADGTNASLDAGDFGSDRPDRTGDAGPSEADSGTAVDAGSTTGFQVGEFDSEWNAEESTRMFWGLGEDSCYLFRSSSNTATASVARDPGFQPGSQERWVWTFGRSVTQDSSHRDLFFVKGRELQLSTRSTDDGSVFRSTLFQGQGIDDEPPTVVVLDESHRPTRPTFSSPGVPGSQFVREEDGMGLSRNLGPQDHTFSNTPGEFQVRGEMQPGFTFVHAIDGEDVAWYRVVPALGVVGFELQGEVFEVCDFRVCSPTGCVGRETCAELSCD